MQNLIALTIREFKAFWYSPMAYVVGALFVLLQGGIFWLLIAYLNTSGSELPYTVSQVFFGGTFFYWLSMLIMTPLLTMRSFSEEKRTGSIELLLTAPVSETQVVVSKFLGAWLSYVVFWASTLSFFVVLQQFAVFDWSPVLTGLFGTCAMGAVFISIGIFTSSLTRNQVIAAVLGFVAILVLFSIGFLDGLMRDPESRQFVEYFSLINHIKDFAKGVVDTRPLVLYSSLSAICLFLTERVITSPRWRS